PTPVAVVDPESDGQPRADNTTQFRYNRPNTGGLDVQYRNDPNVFVAGDLLWYPVEGNNTIRQAPDVYVAFGRPKGDRGSYRQWEEGGIAPQVVFEILSPSNRAGELVRKFKFYERYGVEEYYVYDPDRGELLGWQRQGNELVEILFMEDWVSPRLGVRFRLVNGELELYGRDGRKFATFVELAEQTEQAQRKAEQERARAEEERVRAEQEQARAEQEQARAEQERTEKDQARREAEEAAQRVARLLARLKELGAEPEA
ncbi:MAG: Uma2 family endonuclease, partial [Gemmataceae bacterium]|nr:Uma2 family endonuclease [Gemmataceae bacterium]